MTADWTDPRRAPLGFGGHGTGGGNSPEYIQANLFTLAQIGGLYDFITMQVEKDHLVSLTEWRLDSGAPRALDYLRSRGSGPQPANEKRETDA